MTRIISIVGGLQPTAPTIGTATGGNASASVAFTASSYIGKGTITYTATSSPGGFTGTGTSPITVSGLSNGTAYTFTVVGTTNYGVSSVASAASNSITPASLSSFGSIVSYTVPSNTGSVVSLTSIDQSYKDLVIITSSGATYSGSGGGSGGRLYFNNDLTSGNYYQNIIAGNGNGGPSGVTSFSGSASFFDLSALWAGNANQWAMEIWTIYDYTNTTKFKSMLKISGAGGLLNGGNGTNSNTQQIGGIYRSTSAINSVYLHHGSATGSDGDLRAGSQINIFGVKG